MDLTALLRNGSLNLFEFNWYNQRCGLLEGERPLLEMRTPGTRLVKLGCLHFQSSIVIVGPGLEPPIQQAFADGSYYLAVAERPHGATIADHEWYNYLGKRNDNRICTLLAIYSDRSTCMTAFDELVREAVV